MTEIPKLVDLTALQPSDALVARAIVADALAPFSTGTPPAPLLVLVNSPAGHFNRPLCEAGFRLITEVPGGRLLFSAKRSRSEPPPFPEVQMGSGLSIRALRGEDADALFDCVSRGQRRIGAWLPYIAGITSRVVARQECDRLEREHFARTLVPLIALRGEVCAGLLLMQRCMPSWSDYELQGWAGSEGLGQGAAVVAAVAAACAEAGFAQRLWAKTDEGNGLARRALIMSGFHVHGPVPLFRVDGPPGRLLLFVRDVAPTPQSAV